MPNPYWEYVCTIQGIWDKSIPRKGLIWKATPQAETYQPRNVKPSIEETPGSWDHRTPHLLAT